MVHLPLNVLESEGIALAEEYHAGVYFPAFVLTNSKGMVITRWTGYTGADRFLGSFKQAMLNLTTIEQRVVRCETTPNALDAQTLATYFSDTREYLKAIDYYRTLISLNRSNDNFTFKIFTATAEAVWTDLLPFDSLVVAANKVFDNDRNNKRDFGRTAQIITNVARRTGDTDKLNLFLTAGLKATKPRKDKDGIALYRDLLADYALYVLVEIPKALSIKKRTLGAGWESDPAKFYTYGEWCFKRKIMLEEAERYVRIATNKASDGKFKAKHQRLLAEICFARGKTAEAITLGEQALEQDPTTVYFEKTLNEWREE